MKIDGAWVGWGLGDTGPKVREFRAFMRRKFPSYAGHLADTDVYDAELVEVVEEMQSRYELPVTGIINYATQERMGWFNRPKPTLFTVHGTGVSMWDGPPADVARAVEDIFYWQPIGNYPAAPTGMGRSVSRGRAELVTQINKHPGPFALAGYSQGAIVTSMVYKYDILPKNGVLHHRKDDLVASVTWGNPYRELGVANGNLAAGWPIPEGRGISDDRLEDTPDWWWDYAHGANSPWGRDIYTDVPDDHAGEHMTAIYRLVQSITGVVGRDGLGQQIFEIITRPFRESWAAIRAIGYGIRFITHNPPTLPHVNYDIRPAIDYLRAAAQSRAAAA